MGAPEAAAFMAVNTITSLAQQRNAATHARRQAEHQNRLIELDWRRQQTEAQAQDQAAAQAAAQESRQAGVESEERRRRLARAQAAERASLAGRGVSVQGSGEALLRSLFEEHDRQQQEAALSLSDRLANLRRGTDLRRRQLELSREGLTQRRQWNLLDAAAARSGARLGMLDTLASAGARAATTFEFKNGRFAIRGR
jgi:hypothetical protein